MSSCFIKSGEKEEEGINPNILEWIELKMKIEIKERRRLFRQGVFWEEKNY